MSQSSCDLLGKLLCKDGDPSFLPFFLGVAVTLHHAEAAQHALLVNCTTKEPRARKPMDLSTNLGSRQIIAFLQRENEVFHLAPLTFPQFSWNARIPNSGPWRRNYFCMISWKAKARKHGSLRS